MWRWTALEEQIQHAYYPFSMQGYTQLNLQNFVIVVIQNVQRQRLCHPVGRQSVNPAARIGFTSGRGTRVGTRLRDFRQIFRPKTRLIR